MATLSRSEYWDKVFGCWLGKNCGGTLGAPLEKAYSEPDPYNIDWYPELREGGIPNDDLELQLIWLKAVEERGFDVTAPLLAQYWLDHVGYNWDEYGLHKTNLRLGLTPPVSGFYNNWFRDCMGSPIRSEIWACLAPGEPALAAQYAYHDAIVDHAGGESVWGEMFNAALQSSAFVLQDPQKLLDIALSYIPATSLTARAVQAARAAHRDGVGWKEARSRVIATAPHYVAQFSPPNIGFQVLGWLYGSDFGDVLCTTVNCGFDTDCTGATVGALLGILLGRRGLPERWTAPLGEAIATNESWGGLRNTSTGANPVPANLTDLTNRTVAQGERLLVLRGTSLRIGEHTDLADLDPSSLYAAAGKIPVNPDPLRLPYSLGALDVGVVYADSPAIAVGAPARVSVELHNPHRDPVHAVVRLAAPDQWSVTPGDAQVIDLPAGEATSLSFTVQVHDPQCVANGNLARLEIVPSDRPAEASIPVVFAGARCWQIWGPHPAGGSVDAALDATHAPEQDPAGGHEWRTVYAPDNAMPLPEDWTGVLYARIYLHSREAREVRIGVPATCPRKLWLNGKPLHEVRETNLLRPNYNGDGMSYVNTSLDKGWNTVLVKYVREAGMPPFGAHFILATTGLFHGVHDVGWTQLPA